MSFREFIVYLYGLYIRQKGGVVYLVRSRRYSVFFRRSDLVTIKDTSEVSLTGKLSCLSRPLCRRLSPELGPRTIRYYGREGRCR